MAPFSRLPDLGEYGTSGPHPGLTLTPDERVLAAALRKERRLYIDELIDGLRVTATSWIGVLRFAEFEIRVVPKHIGGDLQVVRMIQYASGIEAFAKHEGTRTLPEGLSLVDLLGWLLADQCESVLQGGLLQDYVAHEETLETLRGRLRLLDQVTRRFGRIDRLECAFDELETDVVENRILAAGLSRARRACRDRGIVRRLARLESIFREACDPDRLAAEQAKASIEYHRRNQHYKPGHELSWLFMEQPGIGDLLASGPISSFAFLLDMNRLFEGFVTRLLQDGLAPRNIRVDAQRRDRTIIHDEVAGRRYGIVPDMLLEVPAAIGSGRRRVPVDAKYKLYDEHDLDSADVYQTFFYAYAYDQPNFGTTRIAGEEPRAIILYPSTHARVRSRLAIRTSERVAAARIDAIGVDIPAALRAIERRRVASLPELGLVLEALSTSAEGKIEQAG